MQVVGLVGLAEDDVAALQFASVVEFIKYLYENFKPTVDPTWIDELGIEKFKSYVTFYTNV